MMASRWMCCCEMCKLPGFLRDEFKFCDLGCVFFVVVVFVLGVSGWRVLSAGNARWTFSACE